MSVFKERLKLLREEVPGLTQRKFAKILNVSSSTVGMWETGERKPDIDTAGIIAKHFNVTSDYLLGLSSVRNYELPEDVLESIGKFMGNDNDLFENVFNKLQLGQRKEFINKIIHSIETKDGNTVITFIIGDPKISEEDRKKAEIEKALTTLVAHDEGEFPIEKELIDTIYDAMIKGREFHKKRREDVK